MQHLCTWTVSDRAAPLQEGPFPAGLVLHSWAGSDQTTRRLARMQGVHFSLSGHSLGLSDRKLAPMLREVRGAVDVVLCSMSCHIVSYSGGSR